MKHERSLLRAGATVILIAGLTGGFAPPAYADTCTTAALTPSVDVVGDFVGMVVGHGGDFCDFDAGFHVLQVQLRYEPVSGILIPVAAAPGGTAGAEEDIDTVHSGQPSRGACRTGIWSNYAAGYNTEVLTEPIFTEDESGPSAITCPPVKIGPEIEARP